MGKWAPPLANAIFSEAVKTFAFIPLFLNRLVFINKLKKLVCSEISEKLSFLPEMLDSVWNFWPTAYIPWKFAIVTSFNKLAQHNHILASNFSNSSNVNDASLSQIQSIEPIPSKLIYFCNLKVFRLISFSSIILPSTIGENWVVNINQRYH